MRNVFASFAALIALFLTVFGFYLLATNFKGCGSNCLFIDVAMVDSSTEAQPNSSTFDIVPIDSSTISTTDSESIAPVTTLRFAVEVQSSDRNSGQVIVEIYIDGQLSVMTGLVPGSLVRSQDMSVETGDVMVLIRNMPGSEEFQVGPVLVVPGTWEEYGSYHVAGVTCP